MFARLDIIEKAGTGIARIRKFLKAEGLRPPAFEDMGEFFKIILYRPQGTQKTTQKILDIIKKNPTISRKEIAAMLGNITIDGVKYQLNKLRKEGLIKRIGPDKGGHWELVKIL